MKRLFGNICYFQAAHFLPTNSQQNLGPETAYGSDWAPHGKGISYKVEFSAPVGSNPKITFPEYIGQWQDQLLNESSELSTVPVTIENIALKLFYDYKSKSRLDHFCLKLWQSERVFAEVNSELAPKVTWAKSYKFNSLHRHYNEDLSADENLELYRKCSNVHGHEYILTILLDGIVNSNTGLVIDREKVDNLITAKVINPMHGSYLNSVIGNTSGETLLRKVKTFLQPHIGDHLNCRINLQETLKNSFLVQINQ